MDGNWIPSRPFPHVLNRSSPRANNHRRRLEAEIYVSDQKVQGSIGRSHSRQNIPSQSALFHDVFEERLAERGYRVDERFVGVVEEAFEFPRPV